MPVRSLNSAVFKWPDRETVLAAARVWARALRDRDPHVEQVGCVGSYARGNWGVGSDLDVIVILDDSDLPRIQRYKQYYPDGLPVQADLWVYTRQEWETMPSWAPHLWTRLQQEWLELVDAGKE